MGGQKDQFKAIESIRWLFNLADGRHDLVDISQRSKVSLISKRRARRAQNAPSRRPPVALISDTMFAVMRNPEMTKKISTPTNPPGTKLGQK